MSVLTEQIEKALRRDTGTDVRKIAATSRDAPPNEVATDRQKEERLRFLRESLGDPQEALRVYERIIQGNEIQAINYLAKGARVAEAVARIAIKDGSGRTRGWGSGFLVAPGVLLTNNHVLPDAAQAARSEAHFRFELDLSDNQIGPQVYALEPGKLFLTDRNLDFTVVAVAPRAENADTPLDAFGFLPLIGETGKVADGEWLTVVQHPNGERKQVCVRENKLLKRTRDVLWYSTDTLGGSSGSPVFNNDWYVVALHHSGIPETKDDKIQTLSGQDYDPARDSEATIKWIANEGIRVSRIVDNLRGALPDHPLLRPMLTGDSAYARLQLERAAPLVPSQKTPSRIPSHRTQENVMNDVGHRGPRRITVTLEVDARGGVSLVQGSAMTNESALAYEAARTAGTSMSEYEVEFDGDYDKRKGFDEAFLGGGACRVALPKLSSALQAVAAQRFEEGSRGKHVLDYHGYSLVMHHKRRFALYTAASVDCGQRWALGRTRDTWRTDPRIPATAQVGDFYYKNNQFDKGHLTRREDMEYGKKYLTALAWAEDTCHWTNCVPQHAKFNRNKTLWQGIERYILEQTIEANQLRAQVLTGPVLSEDDPVHEAFPKIRYPLRFWKIVVALDSKGGLSATAYLLDQGEVISEYGIDEATETPFGAYGTYQVSVREIERLTGLKFMCGPENAEVALSRFDPLPSAKRKKPGRRPSLNESVRVGVPREYMPLESLRSIELGEE